MSAPTKRSTEAQVKKYSPITISPTAVVSETAILSGTYPITIGSNTVIHPRATIVSEHRPVIVGDNCIISERTTVGSKSKIVDSAEEEQDEVNLEDGVSIEVGAQVEARRIGRGSVVGVNARIKKGAILGKYCKVGPLCEIIEGEVLPDHTVVFGTGQKRIENSGSAELELESRKKLIEVLRSLIPSNLTKWHAK